MKNRKSLPARNRLPKIARSNLVEEYEERQEDFERLRTTIFGLITTALQSKKIDVFQVQTRVKSVRSIEEKIIRKTYANPFSDITDIVGARVILYLDKDIHAAAAVLREVFSIEDSHSADRTKLEFTEVGYRSLHLVGSLGEKRKDFIEYDGLIHLRFEVQIRTALQHTWAEIEHKRNYKSEHSLPPDLKRRLMLVSGQIESIEREFSEIVSHADNYVTLAENLIPQILSDRLSAFALHGLYLRFIEELRIKRYRLDTFDNSLLSSVADLLTEFGITTVSDLVKAKDKIERDRYLTFAKYSKKFPPSRLFKFIMIQIDAKKYLSILESHSTAYVLDQSTIDLYENRFPDIGLAKLISQSSIEVRQPKGSQKNRP